MTAEEKTLLASVLLSLWAPLATGLAAFLGRSMTQLADFIRRTVEFLVLLLSWLVFRDLSQKEELDDMAREQWDRRVRLAVAIALGLSGVMMLLLALFKERSLVNGNVVPGLVIGILGLMVNLWFWKRYSMMVRIAYNAILDAQRQLYRAKVLVDLSIIGVLLMMFLMPEKTFIIYLDLGGTMVVAMYLLWNAWLSIAETIK